MAKVIGMPRYGANMTEGTVEVWNVSEGDQVSEETVLGEIAIEKLSNELLAECSGTVLKIIGEEGEEYECGYPIIIIGEEGEDISSLLPDGLDSANNEVVEESDFVQPACGGNEKSDVLATPTAKKQAAEQGIDLNSVSGTGVRGRIMTDDLKASKQSFTMNPNAKATPKALALASELGVDYRFITNGTGRHGMITRDDVRLFAESGAGSLQQTKQIKMTKLQQTIAAKMFESLQTTAQVTITRELDMEQAVTFYKNEKQGYLKNGFKLSYTVILIKAVALALRDFPIMRTTIQDATTYLENGAVNVGIATDIVDGLVVPNIKNAADKSLSSIAVELKQLVEKAQSGKLSMDEMSEGTFTISNLGMLGIDTFTPVLNEGESALLGIGTLREKVIVKNGGIYVSPVLTVSLTHDHRVINGAPAARFLQRVNEYLQNPTEL